MTLDTGVLVAHEQPPPSADRSTPRQQTRLRPPPRLLAILEKGWLSLAVFIVLVLLWELGGRLGWLQAEFFSQPTDIASAGRQAVRSGRLFSDIYSTFVSLGIGVIAGLVFGLIGGIALGRNKYLRWMFEWFLLVLNSLPRVTLAPLVLVALGLGVGAKAWVAFLAGSIPILLLVSTAVQGLPSNLVAVSRAFRLSRWQTVRKIVMPHVMPHCFTGLQLGATRALLAVIVTEMFNPSEGLGRWITIGLNTLNPSQLMFVALLVGAIGAAMVQAIAMLQRVVVRWQ